MHIVHIITGLNTGGAETMLYKLVAETNDKKIRQSVISLRGIGTMGKSIRAAGAEVFEINMRFNIPDPFSFIKLIKIIKKLSPDLIQGWMYHGNIAATAASWFLRGKVPVLWNIRHALYDIGKEKFLTAMIIRLGAFLSRFPKRIIYNSRAGGEHHEELGYRRDKSVIIGNGFDTQIFRPSISARNKMRKYLKVTAKDILIGIVGRYHVLKDQAGFLHAAGIASKKNKNLKFVMVGKNVDHSNHALKILIEKYSLESSVFLLGGRTDIAEIDAALDIFVLSSLSEGFPNVVGEAMSSQLPCIVTDVGESADLVSDTGIIIPPGDPEKLADAIIRMARMNKTSRARLGKKARQRIQKCYSIKNITGEYLNLYLNFCAR